MEPTTLTYGNSPDDDYVLVVSFIILMATLWTIFALESELEHVPVPPSREVLEQRALEALLESRRHQEPRAKRTYINWNRDRARQCVDEDYLGDVPRFPDRQFERVFRVTRSIADRLLQCAAHCDAFFTERFDAANKRGICPKVKLLMALKQLAYGVSPSAFQDYFQMGETTGRECLKRFAVAVSTCADLRDVYRRKMSRADAERVSNMHYEQHGVHGMLGSLDCMHVGWKNCPVAWQGQFVGSKGYPTIVLEAFADYNLWIWHAVFGWAGTNNDINIWDRSSLLSAFLDGTFRSEVDFDFYISGILFSELWLMTDGIYPELSRFVKTIQEPGNPKAKVYAAWQEGARKDVERAFGVLQRKFHILVKHIEFWYLEDISSIVETTIIMHNMMVAHRMERDENERSDWYEFPEQDDEAFPEDDPDREHVVQLRHEVEQIRQIQVANFGHDAASANIHLEILRRDVNLSSVRQATVAQRWARLYDARGHNRLREAIMDQEWQNKEHGN